MSREEDTCSVEVAVRVRPLVSSEISRGCENIIETLKENNQIIIRSNEKSFSFNYVLGTDSPQGEMYERCVEPILKNLFKGLNVTIFAYGQTGSGKTYTMGTNYKGDGDMGVLPRAVDEIFKQIKDNFAINFTTTASFTELYQDVLYDLLANKPRDQCSLEMREDLNRGVYLPNLTEVRVESASQVLDILIKGSNGRAVASTAMNSQSSRSHAIFTLTIDMHHKTMKSENTTVRLNLVDLAGSERINKSHAVGNTFKEVVKINKGLFALGNVISKLGDEKAKDGHIPYRDSILTRLLKDSLGGNSITLMIACVSPADYNLEETMSTLRYADRARKIKNKSVVNQDPKVAEIQTLQVQIIGQGGPTVSSADVEKLKTEIEELLKIRDKTGLYEKLIILQSANEALNKRFGELKDQYNTTFSNISTSLERNDVNTAKESLIKMKEMQAEFTALQSDLIKTETEIRDMIRLKDEGDKKQQEIVKMEDMHAKQQSVLKRKSEEAAALNKRLQLPWLTQELEGFLNFQEAKTTLAVLLEDRATLRQQLDELKNNSGTAGLPEVQAVEEDIRMRSIQIQDLQQKLLDSNEEQKSKTRFDGIQSMAEAKAALRTLFDQAAEIHKSRLQGDSKVRELQDTNSELSNQIEKSDMERKILEEKFDQLSAQQQTYEEKLRGVKTEYSELQNRCQIQSETIESQKRQLEELEKVIENIKDGKMQQLRVPRPKKRSNSEKTRVVCRHEYTDETFVVIDDTKKDPDWKSPIGTRNILQEKREPFNLRAASNFERGAGSSEAAASSLSGVKCSADGGCICKTGCQSRRCGCKKANKKCGAFCKCNESGCENRVPEVPSSKGGDGDRNSGGSSTQSSVYQDANTTFKNPRVD